MKIVFFSTNGVPSQKLRDGFIRSGIELQEFRSIEGVVNELRMESPNAVIVRCEHAGESDLENLRQIKSGSGNIPVILALKKGDVQSTVKAMKRGADDVLIMPDLDSSLIDAVLGQIGAGKKDDRELPGRHDTELIGKSNAMEEVRSAIELVANSQTAVMITGESGTGKEVVARLIHLKSDRSHRPFMALNCAALPKDIIENELFGHEKGAFTGADRKLTGNFEAAHGGTFFFDEIAEMNPDTQAKLLRVLEQKSFRRLGGGQEIHVDVRTIAATNKDIHEAMRTGEFRQDLYYRFSVIEIHLPPLRERKEDIDLLVDRFFPFFKQQHHRPDKYLRADAVDVLREYDWPGNVRELRNIIERVVVTSSSDCITAADLPLSKKKREGFESSVNIPVGTTYQEAERLLLIKTLEHTRNNKSHAAKLLGISRKTLHKRLHEFGLTIRREDE